MAVRLSNPPAVAAPVGGYSHMAEAPEGARIVALAGQVGVRPDGSVPESLEEQAEIALENVRDLAAAAGAGPEDVLKVTLYLTDRPRDRARFGAALAAAFPHAPAMTLLYVAGLFRPEVKIEVDVTLAPLPRR